MRILGFDITRQTKASPPGADRIALSPIDGNGGGWFPVIREGMTGDWQRNILTTPHSVIASVWVFRCVSLIASDIAKLELCLKQEQDGVWVEATSPAFSPVLAKPNTYQNRIQFVENWLISKLTRGNAFVLKERDARNVVVALHVLHPDRVRPLVAPDGSVYYQLGYDNLAGVGMPDADLPAVPASEIIHDRWNCMFHPLVGLSPIYACGLAAFQTVQMQGAMSQFFGNGARPGGILTAPGAISDETAVRLKGSWETNFSGPNAGRVAVLGDGLKFDALMMKATDAQFLEQLKFNGETICAAFGVPSYMVNIGTVPANVTVDALSQMYYGQCLQIHVESLELCLNEGLALPAQYSVEADLDGLIRMDEASQIKALVDGIAGGLYAPNEGRMKLDLPPVAGGDAPYLQQQNYSLEALAKRDAGDPFAKPTPAPAAAPPSTGSGNEPQDGQTPANGETLSAAAALLDLRAKFMREPALHVA